MISDRILELPYLRADWGGPIRAPRILLVAGGAHPGTGWLRRIAPGMRIWAADRGVDRLMEEDLPPELLVGDGDSASPEAWEWAEDRGARTIRVQADKDETDLQLALALAAEERASVLAAGAFGGRFDHLFSAAFSLAGAEGILPLGMADRGQVLLLAVPGTVMSIEFRVRPLVLSLLPMEERCGGVDLSGVRWPLRGARIAQARPFAVSNRVTDEANRVTLRCTEGRLGIYATWEDRGEP